MHRLPGLPVLLVVLVLTSCASDNVSQGGPGSIEIHAMSAGQPVADAQCVVSTAAGRWEVNPPAMVAVGAPAGDLRVICNKQGYRSSEVLYRPSPYGVTGNPNVGVGIGGGSGNVGIGLGFNFPIGRAGGAAGGGYPPRIVVELNPQ